LFEIITVVTVRSRLRRETGEFLLQVFARVNRVRARDKVSRQETAVRALLTQGHGDGAPTGA
jgi:hypothetical protein